MEQKYRLLCVLITTIIDNTGSSEKQKREVGRFFVALEIESLFAILYGDKTF